MRRAALALSLAVLPVLAGQPLTYADGATRLAGYLARPTAAKGKVPGVVVVHQWLGLTDHERKVSDDLAKLGYVALAADIYGEGVHPANAGEAGKLAGSFKGDLSLPAGTKGEPITAKVLVCHGADDPFVPAKDVAAFQDEMRQAKADYVFVAYAGAVHAFTQKEAGHDNSKGAAYNEAAHHRSWQHMKDFFHEIF